MLWLATKLLDPRFLIGVAVVVALGLTAAWLRHGGVKDGMARVQSLWDADKLANARALAKALTDQRDEFQAKLNGLEANHAQTKRLRDSFAVGETAALAAAGDRARESRRLRDAIAASDASTREAADSSGATGKCAAAIASSDLRGRMLLRIDAAASAVESAATGIGRHADAAYAASVECAGAYTLAR